MCPNFARQATLQHGREVASRSHRGAALQSHTVKYVLDSNIVARLLNGDERVLGHLVDIEPSDVGIPLLVLAALLFGAEKSVRKEQNGARIKQMTETFPMLPLGLAVVRR